MYTNCLYHISPRLSGEQLGNFINVSVILVVQVLFRKFEIEIEQERPFVFYGSFLAVDTHYSLIRFLFRFVMFCSLNSTGQMPVLTLMGLNVSDFICRIL